MNFLIRILLRLLVAAVGLAFIPLYTVVWALLIILVGGTVNFRDRTWKI